MVFSITILVPLSASLIVRFWLAIRLSKAFFSLVVKFPGVLLVSSLGRVSLHLSKKVSMSLWLLGAVQVDFFKGGGR